MATIEAVSKWRHEGQCPPRVSRIKNSETASPASSHTPRRTTNTKVKKHSPRQLLARAHQKNNPKTQKGKFMTYTVWYLQDAETSSEKRPKTKMPNIEAHKGQQHSAEYIYFKSKILPNS